MPTLTTNIQSWQSDIDKAIPTGQHKEALCLRLGAMESLLFNQPGAFDNIVKRLVWLLEHGIPCDYILRVLHNRQPLHHHAQPAEAGLLQELERDLSQLGEWVSDKRWLDLFVSIESPSEAANFFHCLRDAQDSSRAYGVCLNGQSFNHDLIKAWLVPSKNDPRYSVIQFPAPVWSLWMSGMRLFEQLSAPVQKKVLPWVVECMSKQGDPKKLMVMLSSLLLIDRHVSAFTQRQSQLLRQWWNHGLLSGVSPETLSVLLAQIIELGTMKEEEITQRPGINLLSSMLDLAMVQQVDVAAILRARSCMDVLKRLKNPLQTICYDIFSEHRPWFGEAWLQRFYRAIELISGQSAILSEDELRQWVDLAINSADVELLFTLMGQINDQINVNLNKTVSCKTVFQLISQNPDPVKHLQALDQLLTIFYALDISKQQGAMRYLKDAAVLNTTRIYYEMDFFAAMADFDFSAQDENEIWSIGHRLWVKKSCSSSELHEKIKFTLLARQLLGEEYPNLLNEMLDKGTPLQRQLMLENVLPRMTSGERIGHFWQQIQRSNTLSNASYLNRVIETQIIVDQLSEDQSGQAFEALLDFDNASQRIPRQTILHAIHHGDVCVNAQNSDTWWKRYFNALSEWIMKPVSRIASELDHAHHASAIKSLQRMAIGVQEIKIIAQQNPDIQSAPISEALITSIKAYESSYNASWWKSSDRQKFAKRLFDLAQVKSSPVTYSAVLDEISEVMQGIVKSDLEHTHRNAKGYSRLYDIALQLLVTTAGEALQHDQAHTSEYIHQLNVILEAQKNCYKDLDLELPAFQHLYKTIQLLNPHCSEKPLHGSPPSRG